jgi:hypothetical protein
MSERSFVCVLRRRLLVNGALFAVFAIVFVWYFTTVHVRIPTDRPADPTVTARNLQGWS